MKKFILALMVMVGVSFASMGHTDETRTIPLLSKAVVGATTVVSAKGATLYQLHGFASSANCVYSVHNVAAKTDNLATVNTVMVEGGEATQFDALTSINFGPDGLEFSTGIVVHTSTCTLNLIYR